MALLAFTSGTTGRPKGVPLTHANLLAGAEALRRAWAWTPDDCLLLSLPLFHMHGLGVGVHGTLLAGASAVLFERFDPEAILRAAAQPRRDHVLRRAHHVRPPGRRTAGWSGWAELRLCVSGSAPLRADLHRRIEQLTGQRVLERYGMTETVMLTSNPLNPLDGERRPGTVGLPLPGVELRLDPETDEIQVRGPNVFGGYLDDPEANAEAFTDDGWFRTGDVGRLDDDGYLRIVGRAKDLIITGGYNVYPAEIEAVVRDCPGVARGGRGRHRPTSVGRDGGRLDRGRCRHRPDARDRRAGPVVRRAPGRLQAPRAVQVVDALPRNALGKIQRRPTLPSPLVGKPPGGRFAIRVHRSSGSDLAGCAVLAPQTVRTSLPEVSPASRVARA